MGYALIAPLLLFFLAGCTRSEHFPASPPTGLQEVLSITSDSVTTDEVDGMLILTLHDVSPEVFIFVNGELQVSNDALSLERVVAEWSSLVGGNVASAVLVAGEPSIGSFEQVAAFEMGELLYSAADDELMFSAILSEGSLELELRYVSVNVEIGVAH